MKYFLNVIIMALVALSITARPASAQEYRLGMGDKIRVTVFGEDDLSGTFTLDGQGRAALPLIGPIILKGMSLPQAEAALTAALADGYLQAPSVSIEVTNHRPFYIIGEVQKPGAYPYAGGLTVMGAVALGGGFTYRADEDDVEITRKGVEPFEARLDAPVLPGDVVRVGQRFF
jgi:protein involved in polysaccharide export with SLBB domain